MCSHMSENGIFACVCVYFGYGRQWSAVGVTP